MIFQIFFRYQKKFSFIKSLFFYFNKQFFLKFIKIKKMKSKFIFHKKKNFKNWEFWKKLAKDQCKWPNRIRADFHIDDQIFRKYLKKHAFSNDQKPLFQTIFISWWNFFKIELWKFLLFVHFIRKCALTQIFFLILIFNFHFFLF